MKVILTALLIITLIGALFITGMFVLQISPAAPELSSEPTAITEITETAIPTSEAPTVPETAIPETTAAETEPPQTIPPETQPAVVVYDHVPLLFQTDYPYIKYGGGTVSTSGCSVSCLAMVASYMTNHNYFPDQMAYHFGSHGDNNIARLEYGCEQMQIPYRRSENAVDVIQALKEGKVAIVLMNSKSIFTSAQHFVVLTGITDDGKILINDPMETNYTASDYLRKGFNEGFHHKDIINGYDGGWIFDKADMPEDPYLFDATVPDAQDSRYTGFYLDHDDEYTMACFIWIVAREEPKEAQQAICEVLLNRVMSSYFPNTIDEVLKTSEYAKYYRQIPYAEPGDTQYQAVYSAMYGDYLTDPEVLYFARYDTAGVYFGEFGSFTFLYTK
ncbi:MAG: C39 family peptidase [Oscillospiraceae bacterium]|nr:C39 family peptidase [Oscillospiraceae bacterium]